MISPATAAHDVRRAQRPSVFGWWLRWGAGIVWRLPVLPVVTAVGVWYAFLGLVHLAFLFNAHQLATFIFAPAILPFVFAPALCFYAYLRFLPAAWRSDSITPGTRIAIAGLGPLVALVVAQLLLFIQVSALRAMGIALPRLPFDAL